MAESSPPPPLPPSPNHMVPPIPHTDPPPPPPPPPRSCKTCLLSKRPKLRVTSEFDSDSSLFFHKVSCKLLDSFAKFKLSFQNNNKGELSQPQFAFTSKLLSIHYDLEEHNALVKGSFDLGPNLHFKAAHDVKVQFFHFNFVSSMVVPFFLFFYFLTWVVVVCRHSKERWLWLLTWVILVMHLKFHLLFQLLEW